MPPWSFIPMMRRKRAMSGCKTKGDFRTKIA